jgi:predicted Zn-dependent peptidase
MRGDRTACRLAAVVPSRPERESVVAEIAAHLLGDPITGLLTDRLRHQIGWSYDVRCQIDDLGKSRVLMCKAVVASRDAHRVGAEMRAIAGAGLAKHVRLPGLVKEARTAVAASRLLVNGTPSTWASELVKTLAAGVRPADVIGVVEQIRSVSSCEVEDLVKRRLVDTDQRTGDRR